VEVVVPAAARGRYLQASLAVDQTELISSMYAARCFLHSHKDCYLKF
jgi:hypothetical protein